MGRPAHSPHDAVRRVPAAEREALLRAIIETAPDALIAIDEHGLMQIVNPAAERLFLYPAEELLGRNVSILMPGPHRERHDGYIARYLRTGEKRIIGIGRTVVGLRKDGSTFPMELAVGEARLGEHRLFTGFVRDLTERQEAERRLHELQAELFRVSRLSIMGEMASGLAHELNQPLTAIMNYVQACRRLLERDDGASPERVRDLMDKAVSQASRGGQIINRLRRFMAAGETERAREDVNRVVEEASALALVGARDKGIAVHAELASGLPDVLIDKIQIHQVIINLIRNSIDALAETDGQRTIVLQTRRADPDEVEVTVADTGPGLANAVKSRLFQPFVTTKADGMGIGLSICRTIVDGHGGRIWASDHRGGGTAFHFTLPAADDHGR
ncbi:MAG TPA: PAS domain S-box protein [Geminicoccaceae bacterium]|nr:PAS domain S-box protein [Geminicoccaceae bacterium]